MLTQKEKILNSLYTGPASVKMLRARTKAPLKGLTSRISELRKDGYSIRPTTLFQSNGPVPGYTLGNMVASAATKKNSR